MRSAELNRVAHAFARAAELQAERERVAALIKSAAPVGLARPMTDDIQLWMLAQQELALRYRQALAAGDFSRWRYKGANEEKVIFPADG